IECVEQLRSKLQSPIFGETCILHQSDVPVIEARPLERGTPGISECTGRRNCERGSVKPSIGAALSSRQSPVGNAVWTDRGTSDLRDISRNRGGEGLAGLKRGNTGDLPSTNQASSNSRNAGKKMLLRSDR